MSNANKIEVRSITLEVENPSIRKTVKLWKREIGVKDNASIITYQGEWSGKKLEFKYFHPNHGELALDIIYGGKTKMAVRTQTSKERGMYFACDLDADENLGVRIG
jgi:hypothetical protein